MATTISNQLKTALIQADLVWKNPKANRTKFDAFLEQIPAETDLVLLPEMFTTGFIKKPAPLAEKLDGPSCQWMLQWAKQLDAAVVGSLIIEENQQYFNRLVWAFPDGTIRFYDKRHLFSYAEEHLHFTAGNSRPIIEWRGWKIFGQICYDLRFPVWSRNDLNYDLLFYVANFPDKRRDAWRTLLKARAIENQSYTIGLNRVGLDGNGIYYAGDSCVIEFSGKNLTHLPAKEMVQFIALDKSKQVEFRKRFAFLQDQDQFTIS